VLREKAAKGAPKSAGEIGTNRIDRFKREHPGIIRVAEGAAGVAAGGELAKKLGIIP